MLHIIARIIEKNISYLDRVHTTQVLRQCVVDYRVQLMMLVVFFSTCNCGWILHSRLLGSVRNLEKRFHHLWSIWHFIIRCTLDSYLVLASKNLFVDVNCMLLHLYRFGILIILKRAKCISYSNWKMSKVFYPFPTNMALNLTFSSKRLNMTAFCWLRAACAYVLFLQGNCRAVMRKSTRH
jgi:hypothetical protein